jgi:hypothetical protein
MSRKAGRQQRLCTYQMHHFLIGDRIAVSTKEGLYRCQVFPAMGTDLEHPLCNRVCANVRFNPECIRRQTGNMPRIDA